MIHRYFPHTQADIDAMLARCGVNSLDELNADVPEDLRLKHPYNLPAEMSEHEVREYFSKLEKECEPLVCFAGAGFYDHYTPSVVTALASRSEFVTAYTPYQPEISQGTLQYIFEYQTMMAELTGLPVSNASMYDGTTAVAEAMMMTVAAARKRNRVLVSATILPAYRSVIDTYAHFHGIEIETIPEKDGSTDFAALDLLLASGDVAGVIIATPNCHGILENLTGVADKCHAAKALLVISSPASALGAIRNPGEWGADIAAGEAQSLGMPLSFGGPYLGYMCCTKALMRKLPGRIVGATEDARGRRVFVLTLQAREQHIRRDKATSNICSNQGLMALYAAIYLSTVGSEGLKEVNRAGCDGAHYLAARLEAEGVAKQRYPSAPYLNEMELEVEFDAQAFINYAAEAGVLAGVATSPSTLLVAVTEKRSRAEIDRLVELFVSFSKASKS
ncbi:MAG: aminomethyl-transferring glycine dehydrogenase subunit GcvPA [Duncaniella sp.]|nr:aminomethyl-transferring glycine dehydrogenase subunit GcvPA [Duncaniella sp.]